MRCAIKTDIRESKQCGSRLRVEEYALLEFILRRRRGARAWRKGRGCVACDSDRVIDARATSISGSRTPPSSRPKPSTLFPPSTWKDDWNEWFVTISHARMSIVGGIGRSLQKVRRASYGLRSADLLPWLELENSVFLKLSFLSLMPQ